MFNRSHAAGVVVTWPMAGWVVVAGIAGSRVGSVLMSSGPRLIGRQACLCRRMRWCCPPVRPLIWQIVSISCAVLQKTLQRRSTRVPELLNYAVCVLLWYARLRLRTGGDDRDIQNNQRWTALPAAKNRDWF